MCSFILFDSSSLNPGRPSKKGENSGDDDLYEMVLRSQVSIKFRVDHLFIQSVAEYAELKIPHQATQLVNSAVYD